MWNFIYQGLTPTSRNIAKYAEYANDPVGYSENVLGVQWWSKQQEIARALLTHKKVFVQACHSVGKTHLAGGLINWHFDCFDPSITKSTAPSRRQVEKLTWKEVRLQRRGLNMLPKAPEIQAFNAAGDYDAGHFAAGFTARDSDSFQGDHDEHLLILFEEACGIDEQFWVASEGMLTSGPGNLWLVILNPTDTGSYAYDQSLSEDWHIISISALEHPNLMADLEGQSRPFPKAITNDWLMGRIKEWCSKVQAKDRLAGDFCWPPEDWCARKGIAPQWYRPGPLAEGRLLGRWPSTATDAIWSEAVWNEVLIPKPALQAAAKKVIPEIGCDVARKGDDFTSIHARRGGVSLQHETHNGWKTTRTAHRLYELAGELARLAGCELYEIPIKIDDDGVGGGVVDRAEELGCQVHPINAGTKAMEEEKYPNRRSELWFVTAERAMESRLDLSLLDPDSLRNLRKQYLAPKWRVDGQGRREVEKKDKTKERIKRSPDDSDACNLAYAAGTSFVLHGVPKLGIAQDSKWQK